MTEQLIVLTLVSNQIQDWKNITTHQAQQSNIMNISHLYLILDSWKFLLSLKRIKTLVYYKVQKISEDIVLISSKRKKKSFPNSAIPSSAESWIFFCSFFEETRSRDFETVWPLKALKFHILPMRKGHND